MLDGCLVLYGTQDFVKLIHHNFEVAKS